MKKLLAVLGLAAGLATACINTDQTLGEQFVATNQKYDFYSAEFDIPDVRMRPVDSLTAYSSRRITIGAVRDEDYGLYRRASAVTLVPVLKSVDFGKDPVLGDTTWNVGLLHSDNPQNILSPELTCRLYFRTTFASDKAVTEWMEKAQGERLAITARGGDTPAKYWTVDTLPSKWVAFGSDAPHLTNFKHKAICGPGTIAVAHRDDEFVRTADLEKAVEQYITLYKSIS